MKQLPLIFLNVAVVVVAIVVYDQLHFQGPAPQQSPTPTAELQDALESLEARMRAIESAPPAALSAAGIDARLIDELERRLGAAAPIVEPDPAASPPDELANPSVEGDPSAAEVEKFRKLAEAARKVSRESRILRRVNQAIEKLGIAVTDEQKEQLVAALVAFEPRRDELWETAKARGAEQGESVNWVVIIRDTTEAIRREFTEQISSFIPGNDAAVLSEALNTDGK